MHLLLLTLLIIPGMAHATTDSIHAADWSTEAHETLIERAFPNERPDCIQAMKSGSFWVDSSTNQLPSRSHLHAMRPNTQQSIEKARDLMAHYVQSEFEISKSEYDRSTQKVTSTSADPTTQYTSDGRLITDIFTYLSSCEHRGRGLHPIMDSTSPAHANFAIWSITDLGGLLAHGDMPRSIENERALFANPDVMVKTISLMRVTDKIYLELGWLDFLFR
jgi:hypothetical protein